MWLTLPAERGGGGGGTVEEEDMAAVPGGMSFFLKDPSCSKRKEIDRESEREREKERESCFLSRKNLRSERG